MNINDKTDFFINLLKEKKLTDIFAVDIKEISSEVDTFIIASASSDRQAVAASDFLLLKAKEENIELLAAEGKANSRWILLDFFDTVIHIFVKEEREYYNLERLWMDGRIIESND